MCILLKFISLYLTIYFSATLKLQLNFKLQTQIKEHGIDFGTQYIEISQMRALIDRCESQFNLSPVLWGKCTQFCLVASIKLPTFEA